MADPVQTAHQLQWNWEGHVERTSQEHLPKLCRDAVGYNGFFDRSLLSRSAILRINGKNCITVANDLTSNELCSVNCMILYCGIPDWGLGQL